MKFYLAGGSGWANKAREMKVKELADARLFSYFSLMEDGIMNNFLIWTGEKSVETFANGRPSSEDEQSSGQGR